MKVFVCNVATQKGETDGFSVADHLEALQRHAGPNLVDYVLANDNVAPLGPQFPASPVPLDGDVHSKVPVVTADVVNRDFRLHHDPKKLASVLMDLYDSYNKTGHPDMAKVMAG